MGKQKPPSNHPEPHHPVPLTCASQVSASLLTRASWGPGEVSRQRRDGRGVLIPPLCLLPSLCALCALCALWFNAFPPLPAFSAPSP